MFGITDNQVAIFSLVIVAVASLFSSADSKDVLLAIASGIVGYLSKGVVSAANGQG